MQATEKEARTFAHYLVRKQPSAQAIRLYQTAMQTSKPDDADQKLLLFVVSHPSSIGLIDAGLVFHRPSSEVRRRLYVMLAILEASPDHSDLFIPKRHSPLYIFVIMYTGMRAAIKAGLGLVLVKVVT
jgi:hypothetical protein